MIFWHDDHAWTNTGHNVTSPTAGLQSNAFSTKTIVQTTLLTIQIGYDIQHVGSFDHQFDIVRIKNLKIKS